MYPPSIRRRKPSPLLQTECCVINVADAVAITEPSQADTTLIVKLKEAFNLVEMRLLDHLVIGDGEFVSMSDRGLF